MATNDPKSRLTESTLDSPSYTSPNGVTDQQGNGGTSTGATTPERDVGQRADQSPGEKIGRFFRRAMERLSGNQRDRDMQDRPRAGDRSAQYGRSPERAQAQRDWRDPGRSRDD